VATPDKERGVEEKPEEGEGKMNPTYRSADGITLLGWLWVIVPVVIALIIAGVAEWWRGRR